MKKLRELVWTLLEKIGRNGAVISNFKVTLVDQT
jgi:hypothetical protein